MASEYCLLYIWKKKEQKKKNLETPFYNNKNV